MRSPGFQRPGQQLTLIDLAIGSQRQTLKQKQLMRAHPCRQVFAQVLVQLAIVQPFAWHDERQQLMVFGRLPAGTDMRLRHLRMVQNALFDLPRLYTKTAHLHLAVDAAQVLDQPLGIDPYLIAGAVIKCVCSVERGQAHETVFGLCGTVAVTPCHPAATQVKLARLAGSNRSLLRVQHTHACIR